MRLDKLLITGSTSGLGKNLAIFFAQKGYDLILTGRNTDELKRTKNFLQKKYKIKCNIITGDLTKTKDIKKIVNFSIKNKITVLVNNAGALCSGNKLTDLLPEQIDKMLKVNLYAPILLTKYLMEHIDLIININSIAGLENKKQRTIYCTTKSGLRTFSNTLRLETDLKIIDVYISKIKTSDNDYGLNYESIIDKIYNAYINKFDEIIIDGRKEI